VSDEKTEQPTHHKLSEARKKGQVAKSNDAVAAVLFVASFMYLSFMGKSIFNTMAEDLRFNVENFVNMEITIDNIQHVFASALVMPIKVLTPLFIIVAVAGIAGNLLQTGWLISTESINPKLNKLNPIEGAKKLFSQKGFMETLKVILRSLIMMVVFYTYLKDQIPVMVEAGRMATMDVYNVYGRVAMGLFYRLTVLTAVIAGLDYIIQYYLFMKDMKMSKQELKEEYKSLEGDPFLKQRMRARQRELMKKLMMGGVKDSRVVITNPTHYACALKFNEIEDPAPILVAKGKDLLAQQIKELAKKHEVPLYENKPLAQLIYKEVDIGDQIPPDMYQAVAEIIAYLEKLDMEPLQQPLRRAQEQGLPPDWITGNENINPDFDEREEPNG
jgi:flagellar biosynthesis protein FliR/FlhB